MINKYCIINGIPLYIDQYMKDGEILKGRKQGVSNPTFYVASPRTARLLLQSYRKQKLMKINENT